ncbi:hypothetical protein [Pseudonocardia spinosispora]|uniref:hypothetical protein n=1 Tax=Pseudonocardia spinosispora TaxID=103441 RepID=UPI0004158D9F|nr:hypothetical protein [Pseudonocardia spinosispora]
MSLIARALPIAATTAAAALAIAGLALPTSSAGVQPMAHSTALASGCNWCHNWGGGGPWEPWSGGDTSFDHSKGNLSHNNHSFNNNNNGTTKAGLLVL